MWTSCTFCRIQNLHISQTSKSLYSDSRWFCRIQNLHISQTQINNLLNTKKFCRIQNLHISQTLESSRWWSLGFVEFKIYISLKRSREITKSLLSFVEFKIYISLKQRRIRKLTMSSFVECKCQYKNVQKWQNKNVQLFKTNMIF